MRAFVSVCVCVRERENGRTDRQFIKLLNFLPKAIIFFLMQITHTLTHSHTHTHGHAPLSRDEEEENEKEQKMICLIDKFSVRSSPMKAEQETLSVDHIFFFLYTIL